jgi:hypothetical protein
MPVFAAAICLASLPALAVAQANLQGQWQTLPNLMPINPVHAALLHNGKVLVVSGSDSLPSNTNFQAAVFDPQTGTVTTQPVGWDKVDCHTRDEYPSRELHAYDHGHKRWSEPQCEHDTHGHLAIGDFGISAAPSSGSLVKGSGAVALCVGGLPSAPSASFNPTTVGGSGSSVLKMQAGRRPHAGTYKLTITGTSGNLVHSTSISLVLK